MASTRLSPRVQAQVDRMMRETAYDDVDDLLEDALRLLEDERTLAVLTDMLSAARDRMASGEGTEYTQEVHDRILERARESRRQGKRPNPDVCP
jgi:Arc/MetJ-type ribon-helix-helix transcriptional regulator